MLFLYLPNMKGEEDRADKVILINAVTGLPSIIHGSTREGHIDLEDSLQRGTLSFTVSAPLNNHHHPYFYSVQNQSGDLSPHPHPSPVFKKKKKSCQYCYI